MTKWFRVCAYCSICLPPVDLFCQRCWRNLEKKFIKSLQKNHLQGAVIDTQNAPFKVDYLWKWQGQDPLLECLIYSLKNAPLPEARTRLVHYLLQSFSHLVEQEKPGALVFPARSLVSEDHGFYLAEALAKILQVKAYPLLVSSQEHYRSLSRRERYQRRQVGGADRNLKRLLKRKKLLFIDDVYTTGATALRAWQALGEPKGFRVCVLAYKGLNSERKWPLSSG